MPTLLAEAVSSPDQQLVHDEVVAITKALGLDMPIEVTFTRHGAEHRSMDGDDAAVELWANGKPLVVRDGDVERVLAYVLGSPAFSTTQAAAAMTTWSNALAAGEPVVSEALALLCRATLGPQVSAVLVDQSFRQLVEMGIPLPESFPDGPVSAAQLEHLVAELPPPEFEVRICPDYLRELGRDDERTDLFPVMWESLFEELGLPQPSVKLRLDSSLRPHAFQFRAAAICGVPWVGLGPEQVLVNDTTERLALMGIDGVASSHPATRQPAALVAWERKDELEAAGLTTWDAWDYLVLCCAAALRENAWRFVTLHTVDHVLDRLPYTELAAVSRAVLPPELLPRVLRELLFDHVPVRDLRAICEALLRGQTTAGDGLGNPVSAARQRLRYAIAHRVSRDTETAVVYLLDPAFESDDIVDADVAEALRVAVAAELAYLPPTAQRPVILTQDGMRTAVRRALQHRFPSMMVVGHSDLPAEWNVQPVARISAS
jgi:type III secretory pathway component EscV